MARTIVFAALALCAQACTDNSPPPGDGTRPDPAATAANARPDAPSSATGASSGVDFDGFDTSIRPQDDFNGYVNGGWIEETRIPGDQGRWGAFDILRRAADENQRAIIEELAARTRLEPGTDEQRIGDFFASFTDTQRLEGLGAEPVEAELAAIFAADTPEALMVESAELARVGVDSPLALSIAQDLGDSTRYTVYLFQSGLTLPNRDYYLREEAEFREIIAAFPGYAETLFRLAGVDAPADRARAVVAVETKLAEHHWPAEDARDVQKIYNVHARDDLSKLTDAIDWPAYLGAAGVGGEERFVIEMPSYTTALGQLQREIPLDDWKSYYAYRVLHARANHLSNAFVDARFDFSGRRVGGLEENQPRWRRGTQLINDLVGEAVGRIYVERHFPPAAKARMEQMVRNLLAAFGDGIETLDWMTPETKTRAEEKRRKFNYKIGYPDQWRDYSALTISRDDLVGNVRRAIAFEYDRQVGKLGGPVDRDEWLMTPQTVNAYYNPTLNEIVFPAAILQPPFFDFDADDAVNYGAIGAVIGHEIGHAFDDNGRNFDGDGNLQSWWNERDDAAFRQRGERLVEHFGGYEPLPGVAVNGQLTLGENIGDLTGVTIAHQAYLRSVGDAAPPIIDGLTGVQRFFIGWAQVWRAKARNEQLRSQLLSDPHSPAEVRVNGPLPHVAAFYDAFDVSEGDRMWLPPERRVKLW
jgi:putative endopeptidase